MSEKNEKKRGKNRSISGRKAPARAPLLRGVSAALGLGSGSGVQTPDRAMWWSHVKSPVWDSIACWSLYVLFVDDSEELFLQEFVVLCVSSGLDLQVKTVRGGWMSQLKKKLMKLRLKKNFFYQLRGCYYYTFWSEDRVRLSLYSDTKWLR